MRIISGSKRGKVIIAPKQLPVRPTTDMAKESLFNIIQNFFDWHELRALDLFAGTGNISYEMASRGCPQTLAVDANGGCIKFIKATAEKLGFDGIQAIKEDALKFVKANWQGFDFIFADPPYEYEAYDDLVAAVLNGSNLNEEGIFILEHSRDVSFEEHPHCFDHRKYGKVHFSIFSAQPVPPEEA